MEQFWIILILVFLVCAIVAGAILAYKAEQKRLAALRAFAASQGWSFEAADASFELLILDSQGTEVSFEVESWRTIVEQDAEGTVRTEATVKIHIDGERIISTAEGNGPVNALDRAMRRAIVQAYPDLDTLRLVDYKVRILDEKGGTGAKTRVLIGTTDGQDSWSTVGVHENVIAASWRALEDAVKFGLLRRGQ